MPSERGSSSHSRIAPSTTSTTRFGPDGDSSSSPPSPWTTKARALRGRRASRRTCGRARGSRRRTAAVARPRRVRERAEHVEHRARPELLPHRRRVAHRRMVRRREHEAEAVLVDRRGDPLRRLLERDARAPRGRPAEPQAELAARFPCFATAAPAAAATSAAAVEMLIVRAPSPPVPTTSTSGVRVGRHRDDVLAPSPRRSR